MRYRIDYTCKSGLVQGAALSAFLFFLLIQPVMAQPGAPVTPEPPSAVRAGETARGSRIMVVAAHPEAVRAGEEILRSGGSAADAAVAVQLVLGLVEPQSSGLGGGGFALYYDAARNVVHTFDGRETAPASAGKYLFRGEDGKPMDFYDAAVGGRAVGVPGMPALLAMIHRRFGARPWRDLFSRAVYLAENGFEVTPRLHDLIVHDHLRLKNFIDTKLYYFPDASTPVSVGDKLVNKDYGRTLRALATGGAPVFYNGIIAEKIVKAVREDKANPGLLSLEDFKNYKAIERKTVCGTYRLYMICTAGEPSSGGLMLLAALGMLESFNLAATGPESARSWHYIGEASRLAFADRNYYMADPHFVQSPGERLIDKNYLRSRAALIGKDAPMKEARHGVPPGWTAARQNKAEPVYPKPPGTTHFTIVDGRGNIISMTSSVEDMFGSRMMVEGFMLNNQLTDFSFTPEENGRPVANRVEGGKRPRSTMTPVIMFAPDGRPALAIGSAGGSAIMGYVLQRIVAIVDWGQDIETALKAPNIVNRGGAFELEAAAGNIIEPLEKMGHPVKVSPLNSGLSAVYFKDGVMTGAADPRREGTAAGF
ncbi:MAG: gamma-glutamyltransferase [Micavibrio sp.]